MSREGALWIGGVRKEGGKEEEEEEEEAPPDPCNRGITFQKREMMFLFEEMHP